MNMNMNKPTQEELNAWEETLRKEGLGINRGRNTDRLNYGYEGGNSGTRTWEDVKIHIPQKRKNGPRICAGCSTTFIARADAKCCGARCRKRLERMSQITAV